MAQIYSRRLAELDDQATPKTVVVPAGVVWVVKCVDAVRRGTSGPQALSIALNNVTNFLYFTTDSGNLPIHQQWTGFQVLSAGESLVFGPGGQPWDCMVSGYQLTL